MRQFLVWVHDGEEEEEDTVVSKLFEAVDRDTGRDGSGDRGRKDEKDKKRKKRKKSSSSSSCASSTSPSKVRSSTSLAK